MNQNDIRPLPSNLAAHRFVRGEPGAGWAVLRSTLSRAAMIGLGLAAVRVDRNKIVSGSLAAAVVIEVWVLARVTRQRAVLGDGASRAAG